MIKRRTPAPPQWTVKGVPEALREKISAAAQRMDVAIGAWVVAACERQLAAEAAGEPLIEGAELPAPGTALALRSEATRVPESGGLSIEAMERLVDMATKVVKAEAELGGKTDSMIRAAKRMVREQINGFGRSPR